MSLAYLGSLSIGVAVPGASTAVAAGMSGINAALDNLLLQLDALLAFSPAPISLAAQLTLAQQMVTSLGAAISAGLPLPDIAAQIAAIAAQVAALTAQIAGIQAELAILANLQAPLAAAGAHGYAFDGTVSAFGDELDAVLGGGVPGGGGGDHGNAIVLVTTIPATWDAMSVIFKVTP